MIRVTKTADPTHVPETGGNVTFTFLVENTGQEDVSLTAYRTAGSAAWTARARATCRWPSHRRPATSCSNTAFLASDNLTPHTNVVTATAVDDEGTQATASDDATVTFDHVPLPMRAITRRQPQPRCRRPAAASSSPTG